MSNPPDVDLENKNLDTKNPSITCYNALHGRRRQLYN